MSEIYNKIGIGYDTTRKADPEIIRRLYNHLQLGVGSSVVDIGCGTGNYTIALKQMGLAMTGVDISSTMIDSGRTKAPEISWVKSDASILPLEDATFNGAVSTLVIHHYEELESPFKETFRVLETGRRYVIFTSSPKQMQNYWLVKYFPKAMEASRVQMPTVETVTGALKNVGFSIVGTETFMVQPNLQDFFLYSGKYKPEMYLDPNVRKGSSTFSSLAHEEEVREGCQRLSHDIDSGKIYGTLTEYSSIDGDYMFIVAQKN